MKAHIRFKELPAKNYGACERCREKPARFYATSDLNRTTPADFVCRGCVTPEAVEVGASEDLYAA